jgi:hypothetical protein
MLQAAQTRQCRNPATREAQVIDAARMVVSAMQRTNADRPVALLLTLHELRRSVETLGSPEEQPSPTG